MPTETGKETDIVCKFVTPANDDIDIIIIIIIIIIIVVIIIIIIITNQKRLVSSPQVCHKER